MRRQSITNGIEKDFGRLSYLLFDDAASLVLRCAQGLETVRADFQSTFHLFLFYPTCFHLLDCNLDDS